MAEKKMDEQDKLVARIKGLEARANKHVRQETVLRFQIGKELNGAKNNTKHGEWGKFLDRVGYERKEAWRYLQLFHRAVAKWKDKAEETLAAYGFWEALELLKIVSKSVELPSTPEDKEALDEKDHSKKPDTPQGGLPNEPEPPKPATGETGEMVDDDPSPVSAGPVLKVVSGDLPDDPADEPPDTVLHHKLTLYVTTTTKKSADDFKQIEDMALAKELVWEIKLRNSIGPIAALAVDSVEVFKRES